MKRLLLFVALAGPVLGSASPPESLSLPPLACAEDPLCVRLELAGSGPRLPLHPPSLEPILTGGGTADGPLAEAGRADPPAAAPAPSRSSVRILVSLPEQKAYVFKGGEFVASSPVSTGRKGYETPVGTFPILQKKVHHRSTTYDNAPMPYMQRLTWSGVALHAGHVTGRPASHGCIRLPRSFAKKLYGMTNFATRVTITRQRPRSAEEAGKLV